MSDESTRELSVVERVLVEVDSLRKESREARDAQAEQTGRVLYAVSTLSDRVGKIEGSHAALAHGYTTLNEEVKRAREEARAAKQVATEATERAETESRAVMLHVGKVQADVASVKTETAAQTAVLAKQTETQTSHTTKLDWLVAIEEEKARRRKYEDDAAVAKISRRNGIVWWLKAIGIGAGSITSLAIIVIAIVTWLRAHLR